MKPSEFSSALPKKVKGPLDQEKLGGYLSGVSKHVQSVLCSNISPWWRIVALWFQ